VWADKSSYFGQVSVVLRLPTLLGIAGFVIGPVSFPLLGKPRPGGDGNDCREHGASPDF
jgi:hypothetical protein